MMRMRTSMLLMLGVMSCAWVHAQDLDSQLFTVPPQYTILKASGGISIDGKATEPAWSAAPWTKPFADIKTGKPSSPELSSRAKMLWDEEYLYVYVLFPEADLWATLTDHDATVYQDNALEIFIDPDGDGHNYIEFQINALGTVWDLIMGKPYRNGGKPDSDWDIIGLKKAIHIEGTLNDPSDQDRAWGIELAFPLKALVMGKNDLPEVGTIWRMNLSRVQWPLESAGGRYARMKDAEGKVLPSDYFSWATQGIVNFHYPERWGYVQFGAADPAADFLNEKEEQIKLALWRCYYLQQLFRNKFGKYASSLQELKAEYSQILDVGTFPITIKGSESQFLIQYSDDKTNKILSIDQSGLFFH